MLVCPRSCATVSMSPVVASTLLANVRRPEWLDPPLMPVGAASPCMVHWPVSAAAQCAQMLQELLR